MDCTGQARREQICREYDITAEGCYKLFGGQTIKSDAGGKILSDKYYLFLCKSRDTENVEKIRCGYPTARHICLLSGQLLPSEFNPFREEHGSGNNNHAGNDDNDGNRNLRWHTSRRQLYNAIMIFITKYGERLEPESIIFRIKDSVESNTAEPVLGCDVLSVNTIINHFYTSIPAILEEFEAERPVRNFSFNTLVQIIADSEQDYNCFA